MAKSIRTHLTPDQIAAEVAQIPLVLAGTVPDVRGLRSGFCARVAFTFLGLVKAEFDQQGRGGFTQTDTVWEPLSPAYLAYTRPIKGRGKPKAGGRWPGGKDGFMSEADETAWKRKFAQSFSWLVKKYSVVEAKGKAAAIATAAYKRDGGRVKISDPAFGGRKQGSDYQTLVDRGILRASLTPGILMGSGIEATYTPTDQQVFRTPAGEITVGTNVPYADYHHRGKGKRNRKFWPSDLPADWHRQIVAQTRAGLDRVVDLVVAGALA